MIKITKIFNSFISNFSRRSSLEKDIMNSKVLSIEKTYISQSKYNLAEYKKLIDGIGNGDIKITEDSIRKSLKTHISKYNSYPLNKILSPEFNEVNIDEFVVNEIGLSKVGLIPCELIKCNYEEFASQLDDDYFLHYILLRNEIVSKLTTQHIYRLFRNSITKVYKEIQSKFIQIPLKSTFFEFFDLISSLKISSNFNSGLIRICFIENINQKYNDRKFFRVISIYN